MSYLIMSSDPLSPNKIEVNVPIEQKLAATVYLNYIASKYINSNERTILFEKWFYFKVLYNWTY